MKRRKIDASRRPRVAAGFTLIEVLLVLIILVIIGSLAVNVFTGTTDRANMNAAKAQASLVASAIDRYRIDMGKYPDKLEDLWTDPSDGGTSSKWGGPYVTPLKPDPWEADYEYQAKGKKNPDGYDFWSNGPDGKSGTDDDIGNW
ncbi:MAG: type II secretion system major pseudopilin GspG [Planctomycetales bacterium]|nr:type II secretion system major pseudopilin GspG [Planctomycetales bacterium]